MIALLERYGGVPTPFTAGSFRQTELAKQMLAGEARFRIDEAAGESLGEQLLSGGACGGDPEIVRMALEHVDWPPEDPRWFAMLEQPLRTWTHGSVSEAWDKRTYLTCTPLGWACRWGQLPLVKLFLDRGADPIEADAEPWARPIAGAQKKGHTEIERYLRERPDARDQDG